MGSSATLLLSTVFFHLLLGQVVLLEFFSAPLYVLAEK